MAQIYLLQEKPAEALKALRRLIEVHPSLQGAREWIEDLEQAVEGEGI